MDIFNFNTLEFMSLLLTFFRISIVVFMLPIFGGDSVPVQVKACMAIVITLALWPAVSLDGHYFPAHPFGLVVLILGEVFIGLTLSLMVQFVFAGIQTGGQVLGFQMGFTMISIADPLSGGQIGITSHYLYMVAVLIFLVCNGHLVMLMALGKSFALIPPGHIFMSSELSERIFSLSGSMFILALHIAAPVMASLFMVELALAFMGRAAPQMNLLMIGFPIKIAVGFFFIGMLFTVIAAHMQNFTDMLPESFAQVLRALSPPSVPPVPFGR